MLITDLVFLEAVAVVHLDVVVYVQGVELFLSWVDLKGDALDPVGLA